MQFVLICIIMLETNKKQQKHEILPSMHFQRLGDMTACIEDLPDCFLNQKVQWKKQ